MIEYILIFIMCMSGLHILREVLRFITAFRTENTYESSELRTIFTFLSISSIITILFVL